jgi:hypothetical protein
MTWTREQQRQSRIKHLRTKLGVIGRIYHSQIHRSRRKGWPDPLYTKDDFYKWIQNQTRFHRLFHEWEGSGFQKNKVPSVDRIDCLLPYSLENIHVLSHEENMFKSQWEKARKYGRPVLQLDGDRVMARFRSTLQAQQATGVASGSIHQACTGKIRRAGGFRWTFSTLSQTF